MKKKNEPNNSGCEIPEWYWTSGLHDACIINIEPQESEIDYSQPKENRVKNTLSVKIDASNALFDISVKEIVLINYKIITGNIELMGKKKIWWIRDRIQKIDNDYYHYELQIDLRDFDSDPEVFTVVIRFGNALVKR